MNVILVAGNSIVVVSLAVKKKTSGKLSRMHLMMLHLALADLSAAFFSTMPQMIWDITDRFQGDAEYYRVELRRNAHKQMKLLLSIQKEISYCRLKRSAKGLCLKSHPKDYHQNLTK